MSSENISEILDENEQQGDTLKVNSSFCSPASSNTTETNKSNCSISLVSFRPASPLFHNVSPILSSENCTALNADPPEQTEQAKRSLSISVPRKRASNGQLELLQAHLTSEEDGVEEKISGERFIGERFIGERIGGERVAGERLDGERLDGERFIEERVSGERIGEERSSGGRISGDRSSGDRFSGDRFSGDRFSGDRFSGDRLSGDRFSGEKITGEKGDGDRNEGDRADGRNKPTGATQVCRTGAPSLPTPTIHICENPLSLMSCPFGQTEPAQKGPGPQPPTCLFGQTESAEEVCVGKRARSLSQATAHFCSEECASACLDLMPLRGNLLLSQNNHDLAFLPTQQAASLGAEHANRASRLDSRLDSRIDPRLDTRLDPRLDPRLESRLEFRPEARQESRLECRPDVLRPGKRPSNSSRSSRSSGRQPEGQSEGQPEGQPEGQTALQTPFQGQFQGQLDASQSEHNLSSAANRGRLFSVGPTFHIQFRHPSTFCWNRASSGDRRLLMLSLFFALVVLVVLLHVYGSYLASRNTDNICLSVDCVKTAATLLSAMDFSVNPCHDFFKFACGNWNQQHVIPDDRSSVSTFEVLADNLQIILKDKIDEVGDQPLKEALKALGGWPVLNENWIPMNWSKEDLLGSLRGSYSQGIIIEQWVGADDKNSTANIIQFDQMSLGLPTREYYLKPSSKKERDAYFKLMVDLAVLLGAKTEHARAECTKMFEFEIELANVTVPEADRHDTGSMYRRMTLKELQVLIPEFDWLRYVNKFMPIEITLDEPVVVYSLSYLIQACKIMKKADPKIVQNYVLWRLVRHVAPHLGGDYINKRIEFRKVMLGVSAERIRWTQCVELVNKRLGMAVGALFIKDHFDPESKRSAIEMISNIQEAFTEILEENEWMNPKTKVVAIKKAKEMNKRIGYPTMLTNQIELSKEYEELTVYADQFILNIFNLLKFESIKNFEKLRKPVNKERWTNEPAVVNAFYNPNKNDIVFPAGILQPFFYSASFPRSLNYGGIGVVIGHEITHGFDEKGRQFDSDGNMKQWWDNYTIKEFRKRAQCIIDQYSAFVLEDVALNINGKMTQGENIADNGGLKQSYRAFKKQEALNGPDLYLPGLNMTHDQLFFLNYAQIWCGTMRPQDALNKVRSSEHSPGPIRVLGPLSNSVDFAKAFKCKIGTRMNPKKKCTLW